MSNDAKVGLVLGVGLVIAVAVVFFRKDLVGNHPADDRPPASVVNPPGAPPEAPPGTQGRQVAGRSTSLPRGAASGRRHVVAEGETLYGLAERYYGDGQRFVELYHANRDVLARPDRLPAGTELVIPALP